MTKGMDDRACLAVYGSFPRDADNVVAYKQWLVNRRLALHAYLR